MSEQVRFPARLDEDNYNAIKLLSEVEGKSMNKVLNSIISETPVGIPEETMRLIKEAAEERRMRVGDFLNALILEALPLLTPVPTTLLRTDNI